MRKLRTTPSSVEEERQALAEQRLALEALRAELVERVAAVHDREEELRGALADVRAGREPAVTLPPSPAGPPAEPTERSRALDERERALDERERALVERVARADASADGVARLAAREQELTRRAAELDARERALAAASVDPDEARLAEIETRLAELREAEKAFMRTHDELAARAEAVTAREDLVAQRERELQDRESGWGSADLSELEARLRRLESQRAAARPQGFAGGFRKLQEGGRSGGGA